MTIILTGVRWSLLTFFFCQTARERDWKAISTNGENWYMWKDHVVIHGAAAGLGVDDGREFEWTPAVGDGQGGLVCCNSWGRKESDTTERLNWTELNWCHWGSKLKESHIFPPTRGFHVDGWWWICLEHCWTWFHHKPLSNGVCVCVCVCVCVFSRLVVSDSLWPHGL